MINHTMIIPTDTNPLSDKVRDDPLGRPHMSMIVGGTGAGKTVLMMNIMAALQDRHEFKTGLFVSGNLKDPTIDAIEIPKTSSPQTLADYLTKLAQAEQGTNHLLTLDDCQGSPDLNLMASRSQFVNFLLSHRHFGEDPKHKDKHGTYVLVTCQTIKNSFTPQIRNQIKNFFLFYPNRNSTAQLKNFEELAIDPIQMRKAMAIVRDSGPHSFLFLNKWDKSRDQYFLNFDKELDLT